MRIIKQPTHKVMMVSPTGERKEFVRSSEETCEMFCRINLNEYCDDNLVLWVLKVEAI